MPFSFVCLFVCDQPSTVCFRFLDQDTSSSSTPAGHPEQKRLQRHGEMTCIVNNTPPADATPPPPSPPVLGAAEKEKPLAEGGEEGAVEGYHHHHVVSLVVVGAGISTSQAPVHQL